MLRTFHFCLPVLVLIFSCPAQGGVIERDWKVAGDGLLTYDDVNQREWLDLSESLLGNFPGETNRERLDNAIAEFGPGGMFEEFTFAKNDDVLALAQSAGIDATTFDFQINHLSTSRLISLLGETVSLSGGSLLSQFLLDGGNTKTLIAQFFFRSR